MNIIIIGTGNIATVLGKRLKAAGHVIQQIWGRDAAAASALAYELDSESTQYWSVVQRTADVYLIAVSDVAIPDVVQHLELSPKIVVHTAAAVSKLVLAPASENYGVFYPLQSLNKKSNTAPGIPILIDASNADTLQLLQELGHSVSETVAVADEEERTRLHVAAVFCSNFVNHLYALAQQWCLVNNLDFNLLLPLIEETAERLHTAPPTLLQTGPAVRRDGVTLQKHEALLHNHPQLLSVYKALTQSIQQTSAAR